MASLIILLSWILLLITAIYLYIFKHKFNYWKNKKVPYCKPTSFLGNYGEWLLHKKYIGYVVDEIYKKFPDEPMIGAYLGVKPVLIAKDPGLIKLITTKDFPHFASREHMDHAYKETFGQSLIKDYGESWKFTRTNMAPMFTSAKLKNMFPLIEDCAIDFEKYLIKNIVGKPVEIKSLIATYTMASFVSCAFGVDLKNFGEANVFQKMGETVFNVDSIRSMLNSFRLLWPNIFYAFGFRELSKDLTIFFNKLVKDVLVSRKYAPSGRNDFVDLFLNLKNTANADKQFRKIDDEYIAGQCLAIFAGGFETSSTTVGNLLYELAKNKEIQDKVHKEIDVYLNKTGGKITYDCLTALPYLSACFDETLRYYPITGIIIREVTDDYTFPSGVTLERGLVIHFPLYALHHDPKFFPNPEEFKPERFYGDEKQEIVPCSYLPFGAGPRICIGMRFAKLQSMPGVITVLRNHKVDLADGMPSKLDFEPKTFQFISHAKGGIRLVFSKRD